MENENARHRILTSVSSEDTMIVPYIAAHLLHVAHAGDVLYQPPLVRILALLLLYSLGSDLVASVSTCYIQLLVFQHRILTSVSSEDTMIVPYRCSFAVCCTCRGSPAPASSCSDLSSSSSSTLSTVIL